MAIFVIGGTGFIGIRVIPLLVARGETVVCMDINPNAPALAGLGDKVTVVRGDVTQFDDVISVMEASKADRMINLSYNLGQDLPPHRATKLNIIGMDNCFEAARLPGVKHTVFASSLAVNGQQSHYGERPVTEDDYRHGDVQYASHKSFNEFQAKDYHRQTRHDDHRGPPGQRHGSGQGARLGRSREHHHPAGAGRADSLPLRGRDALPDPRRRHRRGVRPRADDRQAAARGLQLRRDRRSAWARLPTSCAVTCRTRKSASSKQTGGRAIVRQLADRQHPPGAGIRRAIPAVPGACVADHQRLPRRYRHCRRSGVSVLVRSTRHLRSKHRFTALTWRRMVTPDGSSEARGAHPCNPLIRGLQDRARIRLPRHQPTVSISTGNSASASSTCSRW